MADFTFYYDRDENYLFDEFGNVVYNIYNYITPNDFLLFVTHQEDMIVRTRRGLDIELLYPEFPESESLLERAHNIYNY